MRSSNDSESIVELAAALALLWVFETTAAVAATRAPDIAAGVRVAGAYAANDAGWSPDGTRFAAALPDGVHVDGVRIVATSRARPATQLAWSPDGTSLAFVAERVDGADSIYVVGADGAGLRDLLPRGPHSTGHRALGLLTWLDAGRLLLTMRCGSDCTEILELDVETGRSGPSCMTAGAIDWAPGRAWGVTARDALVRYEHWPPGKTDLEGGCPSGPHYDGSNRRCRQFDGWSLDGSQLVTTGWTAADPTGCSDAPPEGSRTTVHARTRDGSVAWTIGAGLRFGALSSDGAHAAALLVDGGDLGLVMVAREGAGGGSRPLWLRPLGRVPRVTGGRQPDPVHAPVFSPDGRWLVVNDGEGSTWAVRADGLASRPLTAKLPCAATWSPDGSRILLRPLGRSLQYIEVGGLERYVDPHAGEDLARPRATLVEAQLRRRMRDARDDQLNAVRLSLAGALWSMGRLDEAEGELRRGLADLGLKDDGTDTREGWRGVLHDFLLCTRRGTGAEVEALAARAPRGLEPPPGYDPANSLGGVLAPKGSAPEPYDPCARVRSRATPTPTPTSPSPIPPPTTVYVIEFDEQEGPE